MRLSNLIVIVILSFNQVSLGQIVNSGVNLDEKVKVNELFTLFNTGEDDKAYQKAHDYKKVFTTSYGKSSLDLLLANYFKKKSLIDSSMLYTNRFLTLIGETNTDSLSVRGKILAYHILGSNYSTQGLLEESKKWFFKGIEKTKIYNEIGLYYRLTFSLANVYVSTGETEKAFNLFKECLNFKENKEIIYGSYLNMGIGYANRKEYALSDSYLIKAESICRQEENFKALCVVLINLAMNAQEQEKINKAILYLDEANKISHEKQFFRLELVSKMSMGDHFLSLKNYKDASLIFSSALLRAKTLKYEQEQVKALEKLQLIAIETKNFESAYHYSNQLTKVKDGIQKKQNLKEIKELEVRYETLRKDKDIAILKVEKRNKDLKISKQKSIQQIIIIAFLILLIPVIVSLIFFRQKLTTQKKLNKKNKELNTEKIEKLLNEQELQLVKANIKGQNKERKRIAQQIHDSIGGNLAAIKLQIENPKVQQQLNETYEELRSLSHDLIRKKFTKDSFYVVLEKYLKNIGEASQIEIEFHVTLPKENLELGEQVEIELFKVVQELMTNVVKHAKATLVEFHMNLTEDQKLNVVFADNGVGFDYKKQKDGIGLTNIKERLHTINGSFKIDAYKGTIVTIQIENTPLVQDLFNLDEIYQF